MEGRRREAMEVGIDSNTFTAHVEKTEDGESQEVFFILKIHNKIVLNSKVRLMSGQPGCEVFRFLNQLSLPSVNCHLSRFEYILAKNMNDYMIFTSFKGSLLQQGQQEGVRRSLHLD